MKCSITPVVCLWLIARPAATTSSGVLPWLHNFAPTAKTSDLTPSVTNRMAEWRAPDLSCSAATYGGLAITAEVAPAPGAERVLASFTQGILVLDTKGELIASTMPFGCAGSADELVGLAAGDAYIDRPVIALAVTTGGHRESATWLVLSRVEGSVVAPVFAGIVEHRAGDRTRAGDVTLLPGALVYRTPSGMRTLWTYDAAQHRYVPPGDGSQRADRT
ncbi:MAG TPA: hypothetical protein VHN14_32300 [Kofleriaceae bacterium]|nr:hypothetical protein [Kofleriaceae bacterium]